jgi:hypothetical protein
MEERERNEIALRAFHLGVRAALNAHGLDMVGENHGRALELLGEIARGETTLQEPTEMARGLGGAAEVVVGIGNDSVRADRELAEWIVAGLNRAIQAAED